jgi:hypothetical protein
MILDRRDEEASRMLAVKAVCACDGRSNFRPRVHLDSAGAGGWVEGDSATGVDSTGIAGKDGKRQCSKSAKHSSSQVFCLWTETEQPAVLKSYRLCMLVQAARAGTLLIFSDVTSRHKFLLR